MCMGACVCVCMCVYVCACVCMCVSCEMTWVLIVLWLDRSMLAGRPKNEGRSMSGRELIRDW